MSKNKLQKFREMETFPHVFQHPVSIQGGGTKPFPLKGKWNSFFQNQHPITLELGCGKGEYTVALAQLFPDQNFIGIDIKGARMWRGAKESLQKELKNVAFIRTDIEFIPFFFDENEVSEIWLTFPDPQMKKVKKRLTSTRFMQLYKQFLIPNGVIHLKTDSPFLYTYTSEMIHVNKLNLNFKTYDLYHSDVFYDKILSIKTFYEQQWIDRGLTIKYIKFQLTENDSFIEPDIEIERDAYRSFNRNKRENNG